MDSSKKRVAVIGLAFRFPGTTTEQYWADLLAGRNLIGEVEPGRWALDAYLHPDPKHPGTAYTKAAGSIGDVAGFDADFFGISPREASLMDPQQRLLLELAWETLESATMQPAALRGSDCGVYVGIASTDYAWRVAEDLDVVDAAMATGNAASIAANRLSYVYDLHGPSVALDTACSSSLVAFHHACQAIVSGECRQALAGGINLHLHPYGFIGFSKATMLSRSGRCRVFDAAADGYVRSEGGGLFLLKDYEQARADGDPIWAVVAATVVNTDGRKSGLTIPCAKAQAALMQQACQRAGINPGHIDYLEAHGTGTPVGDPIEAYAIGMALGQPRGAGQRLPIGSVKSNMGHLETASGVAGLVKAIYALHHRIVPATIGVQTLNPNIHADEWNIEVLTHNRALPTHGRVVIGVNSFGFGGANAHAILMSAPEDVSPVLTVPGKRALAPEQTAQAAALSTALLPVILTGKTNAAVRDYAARLADALDGASAQTFYDTAYHLARRRQRHAECAVIFATDAGDASQHLRELAVSDTFSSLPLGKEQGAGPVFVYSGNGSQWFGMGASLLAEPAFAQALVEIDALFVPMAGWSLAGHYSENQNDHDDVYAYTETAQPALFGVQVGVTRMLAQRGIVPAAVIGHSVGEVAAAWASGALSLDDAVRVIYHRSRLQGLTKSQGQMSAVGLGAEATQHLLEELDLTARLHLAGVNSPSGSTVAGDASALQILEAHCAARQCFAVRLKLDYAFHSPAMEPIETELKQSLAPIVPRATALPFYSTVTGAKLDGEQLDAGYWWHNVRAPVQFADAVQAACGDSHAVFVEVSPHAVLQPYLKEMLKGDATQQAGRVITTLKRHGDAPQRLDAAAGQVMVSGAQIDWDAIFADRARPIVLPAYAWQHERYWHPSSPDSAGRLTRQAAHPLLGYALRQTGPTRSWQQQLDTQAQAFLADHVVGGAVVFPGAGYVELALAAAWQWQHDKEGQADSTCYAEIEELEIRAPLLLSAAPSQLVCTSLDTRDGRVRIQSKAQGADGDWSLHATARVLQEAGAALLRRTLGVIPERAPDFTDAEHRALTAAVGLNYGPTFCAVAQGWHEAPDTVLACLSAHESVACAFARQAASLHLHPALLDCGFQLIVHLLKQDVPAQHGVAFVPVKIGRLALAANQAQTPEARQARYVRVCLRRRAPRSLTADFDLYDANGVQIAAAHEVRFRSVRLKNRVDERLSFMDMVATPRPLPDVITPSAIDAAHLREQLGQACRETLATDTSPTRWAAEVEPLLEALCDCYAAQTLASVTDFPEPVQADTLLMQLRDRAQAAHQINPEADRASAADIWNTLLREYPDYFAAIHALGGVGLHLPSLLRGQTEVPQPAPIRHATLFRLACGPALLQSLIVTLTDTFAAAQAHLPHGQRLAILEIAKDEPLLASACSYALNNDCTDYVYTTTSPELAEQVQQHCTEERWPFEVRSFSATDGKTPRADMVLVQGGFDTLAEARQALAYAGAWLKPGGTLLLLGHHPAQWVDFLFGAQPQWWGAQQAASYWQAQLQSQGLCCDAVLNLAEQPGSEQGSASGAYLLLATRPADSGASEGANGSSAVPAVAPRGIVLLTGAQANSAALATALQAELIQAGHRCHVHTGIESDADKLAQAVQSAREQGLGEITDIVHLDGWGSAQAAMSAAHLMQAQVHRCALAAAITQTCARAEIPVTIWLLTSGLAAQFSSAAPKTTDLASFNDAALWGYGRSLINEAQACRCRVRLIDLPTDAASKPRLLMALAHEFHAVDTEDEVLLDANGARSAPRLKSLQRPVPAAQAASTYPAQENPHHARLGFEFPGQLRHLRWESFVPDTLADDGVQVRVHATGLNFRDLMYTLGLLSDEAVENGFVGATLGLEFAGVVMRTGKNVRDYRPGDAVLGFGPASFATCVQTPASTLARIPSGLSFEAAATLPSTFFTVYYALHHLAHLQAGDKVLIHGAAGGVGIAAVQYAQYCGAQIYATAGSDEKRDFLRLMGVQHVYDSRSLVYADQILADTDDGHGNRGVDIVLNSLAGEAINRNLSVLKPFGRFLELGKRDFYENTHIGLRPFRNNVSYFGIDADQLMIQRPDLTRRLFGELMELFAQEALHPLPYTAFDANEVVAAFRHMQQARQIGKIVITYRQGIKQVHNNAAPAAKPASQSEDRPVLRLPAQASYLVTGGLSGLGLRTAQWLANKGARHLVLLSRSGLCEGEAGKPARAAVAALQAQGVRVLAAACDVTDRAALAALLAQATANLPPLKGIVHAAAVIEDSLAINATPAQIEQNLAAKVLGAYHLHELTHPDAPEAIGKGSKSSKTPLDFCIYYSSATTLFGNPGQSAYVAANVCLESLAAARRAAGLPALCVRWGAIDDVGFLARNEKIKHALQTRMGGAPLVSDIALHALEDMLLSNTSGLAVLELDWRALARYLPAANAPKFADVARWAGVDGADAGAGDDIAHLLASLDDSALHARIIDLLKAELADILRISTAKIDAVRPIHDMGMDSLMGLELVVALENRFGVRLPVMVLNDTVSVTTLAQQLVKLLRGEDALPAADDLGQTVAQIAASHAAEVSPASVEAFVAEVQRGQDGAVHAELARLIER